MIAWLLTCLPAYIRPYASAGLLAYLLGVAASCAPAVAGAGLAQDGSGNLDIGAAANAGIAVNADDIALDLNDLATAAVNVAADSIAIIDADDSNVSKKESIADLVAGMAGAGVTQEVLQRVLELRTSENRENKNPLNSCQTSGV